MIRIIVLLILMLIFVVITLPFLPICYLTKFLGRKLYRRTSLFFVKMWSKLILFCSGAKVKVIGKNNIPKDEAVLFVGNHRSLMDIPLFYGNTPKPAGFVAKKEIDKIPLINIWMRCIGCLFLDRSSPREGMKTILKGIEMLKTGDSLFIFPEGTRTKTGETGHFKPGSLRLAEKSKCTIIPVGIIGTENLFESNNKILKSAKCKLIFGEPVRNDDIPEELKKNSSEFIKEKIIKLLEDNK